MAEFSIDRDIAPLRGSHFPKTLTQTEVMGLSSQYGSAMDAELDRSMKLGAMIDAKRDRDLRYQMNLDALQYNRERAQRERDNDAQLGKLSSHLNTIITGETSDDEKAAELASLRVTNPQLFKGRGAAGLYDAANLYVGASSSRRAKEEARLRAEAAKLAPYVSNLSELDKRINADGVVTSAEAELRDVAQFKTAEAETTQRIKEQETFRKKGVEHLGKQVAAIESALTNITEVDAPLGKDKYGTKKVMSPKSRNNLLLQLASVSGKPLKELRTTYADKDEELFDTLATILQQRKTIYDQQQKSLYEPRDQSAPQQPQQGGLLRF